MSVILGHLIVIAVLAITVFFCTRTVLRQLKSELSGHGTCADCAGCTGCTGCSDAKSCNSCSARTFAGTRTRAPRKD